MTAYPTTLPAPNRFSQKRIKRQSKEESEAGYVMSRALATGAKQEFELVYNGLTEAEKGTLETHFDANLGSSFSFTVPKSGGSTYTVLYFEDELPFVWGSQFQPTKYQITLVLREV